MTGTVGSELAAEIIEKHPKKSVILVHSKGRLMERGPEKVSMVVEKWLMEKGVKIIKEEKIVNTTGNHSFDRNIIITSFRKDRLCNK